MLGLLYCTKGGWVVQIFVRTLTVQWAGGPASQQELLNGVHDSVEGRNRAWVIPGFVGIACFKSCLDWEGGARVSKFNLVLA